MNNIPFVGTIRTVLAKFPRQNPATPSVASTLRAVPMIELDVTRFDIAPPEDVTPLVPPLLAMMSFCMVRTWRSIFIRSSGATAV
jgi:hypothetical protein